MQFVVGWLKIIKNKPTQISLHAVTLLYFKGDKTVQPQGSESQSIGRSGDEDSDKENHPADGGDKAVAQGDTDASPAGEGADTLKKVGNIL